LAAAQVPLNPDAMCQDSMTSAFSSKLE